MEQSIQARFSRKITVLSFVATVMIVGMHTGSMLAYSSNAGVLFFRQFFTQYLFDVAVPFFFVVSGYWFAQGYCRAGAKYNSYSGFVGKKVKTLLVPYLVFSLWGFVSPALYALILNNVQHGLPWFSKTIFENGGVLDFINKLFAIYGRDLPMYNGPLWYVRALLIFFMLAPIWRFLYRKCPLFFLLLFLCIDIINPGMKIGGGLCLQIGRASYFFLGMYLASIGFEKVRIRGRYKVLLLLAVAVVIPAMTIAKLDGGSSVFFEVCKRIYKPLLLGLFWFGFDSFKISESDSALPWWINSSFFIYCIHCPLIGLNMFFEKLVGINDGWCLVYFPFAVVFYVTAGLLCCYLLKRYLPKVHLLVGGGRG